MSILNLLYPLRCPMCGNVINKSSGCCADCKKAYPNGYMVKKLPCGLCVAPFEYGGIFKKAVIDFKFYNHSQYKTPMAVDIVRAVNTGHKETVFHMVTFVPMTKKAENARGYNQSELLAKEVAKRLSLPCKKLIIKTHDNKTQHKLNRNERAENVKGVFATNPKFEKKLENLNILLIDDIVTTGSTLNECISTLQKADVSQVFCAAYTIVKENI